MHQSRCSKSNKCSLEGLSSRSSLSLSHASDFCTTCSVIRQVTSLDRAAANTFSLLSLTFEGLLALWRDIAHARARYFLPERERQTSAARQRPAVFSRASVTRTLFPTKINLHRLTPIREIHFLKTQTGKRIIYFLSERVSYRKYLYTRI